MIAQSVCQWQWHALSFHPARPRRSPPRSFPSSQLPNSLSCPKLTRNKLCRTSSSNDTKPKEENAFFDEDGVVQDMDGYLNYLSLEYDSVWDTKPSWCQPWTITLTGVLIITSSWILVHSTIVTAIVLTLICAWWYIFLYSYPKVFVSIELSISVFLLFGIYLIFDFPYQAYSDMIAERRKKVTSGLEDTYGLRQINDL